jgi:hypothetical protein
MARVTAVVESQAAQPAGVPSGTTFNGYICAYVPGVSSNGKVRRILWHVRGPAGTVTSDQHTLKPYRQTVRPVGTGFTTVTLQNTDQRGAASVSTGIDITTAAAAGTTGPTLGANPLTGFGGNTQTYGEFSMEFPDDQWTVDQGTANGLALVNIGNALPASHLFVIAFIVEE